MRNWSGVTGGLSISQDITVTAGRITAGGTGTCSRRLPIALATVLTICR